MVSLSRNVHGGRYAIHDIDEVYGPKRTQAARELAKKLGIEIKQVYLTTGESDLVAFVETSNGDNVAKMALALGSAGNVHTRISRAWTEEEYFKLVSELP